MDSKSSGRDTMPIRVPPSAPNLLIPFREREISISKFVFIYAFLPPNLERTLQSNDSQINS